MTVQDIKRGQLNVLSLGAIGVTPWVALKLDRNPFEMTMAVDTDAAGVGQLTAKVQYILSLDPDAALAHEIRDHVNLTGITDHKDDKLEWPATHVRMNITAWTAGVANFKVLQPGSQ